MAEIWVNVSGEISPEKEMEMAWSHPTEATLYNHQDSLKGGERDVVHGTPGDVR